MLARQGPFDRLRAGRLALPLDMLLGPTLSSRSLDWERTKEILLATTRLRADADVQLKSKNPLAQDYWMIIPMMFLPGTTP